MTATEKSRILWLAHIATVTRDYCQDRNIHDMALRADAALCAAADRLRRGMAEDKRKARRKCN